MTTRSKHARELALTEDDVREEHEQAVNVPAHWIYMVGVLVGAFLLMLALMSLLGATPPSPG